MNTYPTEQYPLGSTNVKVFYNNVSNADEAVNDKVNPTWIDRFGATRKTFFGMETDARNALLATGFEFLGDYDGDGPLTITRYNQTFTHDGEFWRPGPDTVLPFTTTGVWATDQPNFVMNGDASLRNALADPTQGAALVGFRMGLTATDTNLNIVGQAVTNAFIFPSVHCGYNPSDSLSARTMALQAAFDLANTTKRTLLGDGGTYQISHIATNNHTEYSVMGTMVIVGVDPTWNGPVFESKNSTGVRHDGCVLVSGNSLLNYTQAIKVWASGDDGFGNLRTCSLNTWSGWSTANVAVGWQFGDFSAPDNLLSEMVVSNGFTYNTPQPVIVIGSQAVIEFNGYQMVAGGSGAFAGNFHCVAWVYGGRLLINGGECQIPGVSNGYCFAISPINSPNFDNSYGSIDVDGAAVESASLLFIAYNPELVPTTTPLTGGIRMSHCWGYHSFTGPSFQDAASSGFSGRIVVDQTCAFRAGAVRSAKTVQLFGTAEVELSDMAFNENFRKGLDAISGGIAIFDYRKIFEAFNLSGETMPTGGAPTVCLFQSVSSSAENSHFYGAYVPATGVFTVPTGGLKSVVVNASMHVPQPNAASSIQVRVGNTVYAAGNAAGKYAQCVAELGDLPEGSQIVVQFSNAGTSFSADGISLDRLVISARR